MGREWLKQTTATYTFILLLFLLWMSQLLYNTKLKKKSRGNSGYTPALPCHSLSWSSPFTCLVGHSSSTCQHGESEIQVSLRAASSGHISRGCETASFIPAAQRGPEPGSPRAPETVLFLCLSLSLEHLSGSAHKRGRLQTGWSLPGPSDWQ